MLCLGAPRLEPDDLQELDVTAFASRFKITSKLGKGGFADVLCVRDACSKEPAALKVLSSSTAHMLGDAGSCSQAPAQAPEVALFREARALKHAQHTNVVQLQSVMHIPKACLMDTSVSRGKRDKAGTCWCLLMELLQGGSLQQQVYNVMVHPHSTGYSYLDALTWATDIAAAVAHLHSLNPVIIHRDLKLENILLKPGSSAAANGRKLPVAKLTDFGLHVMIDRPPGPFCLATGEDGMLLLILGTQEQQQQQQQQEEEGDSAQLLMQSPSPGQQPGQMQMPSAQQQQQQQQQQQVVDRDIAAAADGSSDALTASNSSADAQARIALARCSSGASKSAPLASALKSSTGHHQQQQQQQQQQQLSRVSRPQHVAFAVDVSAAAEEPDAAPASVAGNTHIKDKRTPTAQQQQQQQQQRLSPAGAPIQWTRLTAGTLRRLSMDSLSSRSYPQGAAQPQQHGPGFRGCGQNPSVCSTGGRSGLEQCAAIPLMIQPPCLGQSSSFVNAAVPADAFAAQDAATAAAAAEVVLCAQSSSSSSGGSVERVGGCGSISSILAAANSQRDYEVNLKPAVLRAHQLQRKSPGMCATNNGNTAHYSPSCLSDATNTPLAPATPTAAAAGTGASGAAVECPHTPRSCAASVSGTVRSGDWPTAASMMWEDLMDDEVDQELLLGGDGAPAVGGGHGGSVELPLSYNLTGHTGSFMAMAPEVYERKPYNESVDVFSMGVMFYELFSRTLLIYTHTPANSAADCEKYAAQIATGFRPKRVKRIPSEMWDLIEACWQQDPAERPAASEVLRKLQQLLQQAQAEAAAAKSLSRSSRLGMLLRRSDPGLSSAATPGKTATQGTTSQLCHAGAPAAAVPSGHTAADSQGACSDVVVARPHTACGCVIC